MAENKKIWPARLHHFALTSEQPGELADWYVKAMGYDKKNFGDGYILGGGERNLLILPGKKSQVAFSSYSVADQRQLVDVSFQQERPDS